MKRRNFLLSLLAIPFAPSLRFDFEEPKPWEYHEFRRQVTWGEIEESIYGDREIAKEAITTYNKKYYLWYKIEGGQ